MIVLVQISNRFEMHLDAHAIIVKFYGWMWVNADACAFYRGFFRLFSRTATRLRRSSHALDVNTTWKEIDESFGHWVGWS